MFNKAEELDRGIQTLQGILLGTVKLRTITADCKEKSGKIGRQQRKNNYLQGQTRQEKIHLEDLRKKMKTGKKSLSRRRLNLWNYLLTKVLRS